MADNRPVGPIVDATPAERPGPVTLSGRFATLEKLDPGRHGDDLWQAVKDDATLYDYMAFGPFAGRPEFDRWLVERAGLADPYAYAVTDKASGKAVGMLTLMEIRPAMRVIEVGNILYGTPLQRSPAATEAQYLIMRHAFETLRYRRYEWKCNALNAPSVRAAGRFGFTFEGVFRQHMIIKGRNRDTAWFSITDGEWPARKAAFERWLDPGNFGADGRQKTSLSSLNAATATRFKNGRIA